MKIPLTLALVLPSLAGFAQTLTNDGATITVEAGATLYVAGGVQNNATSTLINAGTLQVMGDLNNTGGFNSSGTLLFVGAANQMFKPGTAAVATLLLQNTGAAGQNTLAIPADLTIGTALTLQSGLVRTSPNATLTLPDGATLSGEGPGRYVQGNLTVVRAAGTGVLDFGHGIALDRTGLGQVAITRTAGLLTDDLSRATGLGATGQKSIDRIWTVEPATAPAAPLAVTLQWLPDDDNGLTNFAQSQAWRAPLGSSTWAPVGAGQAATVTATNRSFSFATAVLGRLTLGGAAAPLPVELTRFTAEAQGKDALLLWNTASEKNNDHFDVEASADGRQFQRIGRVAGHGTTSQPQQYKLVDKNIAHYAADPVYYRLRQVDTDGTAVYSPVRTVRVSGLIGFAAQLYPTRVQLTDAPTLLVRTAEAGLLSWQLTDAVGRTVGHQSVDVSVGTTLLPLPEAAGLAAGVYLMQVQQGSNHQVLKMVRD